MTKPGTKNRLSKASSPYLLQHQDNPVDWFEWSNEAFEKAKSEDKPVFLSIGYSTCHWCHVMAHESFEDEELAAKMNEKFVSIKVDREERPDIDGIYMTVCQMLTGSGGWPLTIIMTPDKKPFFAATYIPKTSRYGRIGMFDLIDRVMEIWNNERDKAIESAASITDKLNELSESDSSGNISSDVLRQAANTLDATFDESMGGFNTAPKFPIPHNLTFLMKYHHAEDSGRSLEMVTKTLKEMRLGGIWDHVGYGFHRYSTDKNWLLPHFEKMLYDQALMMLANLEAHAVTKDPLFLDTALKTALYLQEDLWAEEGAFFSAEDADSEGEEGKFYVWGIDEIRKVLGKDADTFIKLYNLEEDGNFVEETAQSKNGKNIPHLKLEIPQLAPTIGMTPDELIQLNDKMLSKLRKVRNKRVRPGLDDKILTDWNGLAIAALARAYRSAGLDNLLLMAEDSAEFLLSDMFDGTDLLHRYRDEQPGILGMLDDYAFLIWGLLELYQANYESGYLKRAMQLTDLMIEKFWDEENGGFYINDSNSYDLIARRKDVYDGAQPSGNSVALTNLLILEKLTGIQKYKEYGFKQAEAFAGSVNNSPANFTHFIQGIYLLKQNTNEIVIVGERDDENVQKVLDSIRRKYLPFTFVLLKDKESYLDEIVKFTKDMKQIDGKATFYLCRNFACEQPVNNADKFIEMLDELK